MSWLKKSVPPPARPVSPKKSIPPANPAPPRKTIPPSKAMSSDQGSRGRGSGRGGGKGGDRWGPGGRYNPDGWGCAAIVFAPVLALLALVALAVAA
jgi:hypothetical protein